MTQICALFFKYALNDIMYFHSSFTFPSQLPTFEINLKKPKKMLENEIKRINGRINQQMEVEGTMKRLGKNLVFLFHYQFPFINTISQFLLLWDTILNFFKKSFGKVSGNCYSLYLRPSLLCKYPNLARGED